MSFRSSNRFAYLIQARRWPHVPSLLVCAVLSAVLGLACYLLIYSRYPLYVTHVNWIYNAGGDALQHQLGWEWFRREPWRFPLGSIQALGYPVGTSVTYMDAIPLFAIPFKLLSPWLEPSFQYFGLWELLSLVLQILFGLLIARQFTRSYLIAILVAALLALSPPLIFRAFYHSSLSAHWILLAAIWFVLLEYRGRLWRPAWPLLFGLAVLVHLYFLPMLLPLWAVSRYFYYRQTGRPAHLIFDLLALAAVVAGLGYLTGVFTLSLDHLSITGYGLYSWNLNGLVNPLEFSSAFLKGRAVVAGQYEGFSYLGLGFLLILPAALYLFPQRENLHRRAGFILPFAAASLIYLLFAVSHRGYLDLQALWELPLPAALLGFFDLFRSSGRFIWPVYYFILLFGLVTVIRHVRFPAVVLLAALLLQAADLQPLFDSKRMSEFAVYQTPLQAEFWPAAAEGSDHLIILPARKVRDFPADPLAIYAAHNDLTLNYAYFARADTLAIQKAAGTTWIDLSAGRSDPRSIYVFSDPEWTLKANETLTPVMWLCQVDGYTLALSPQHELVVSGFDLSTLCLPSAR